MRKVIAILILSIIIYGCGKKGPLIAPEEIAPKRIVDLKAFARNGNIDIMFTIPKENKDGSKLEDLRGFRILRRDENIKTLMTTDFKEVDKIEIKEGDLKKGDIILWTDNNLEDNFRYSYKVISYNSKGYLSDDSNIVNILWSLPPNPPETIKILGGDGYAEIYWELVGEVYGYNIYRRKENEEYGINPINSEPIKDNTFKDVGLSNNVKYYYVLRSIKDFEGNFIEGRSSKEIEATPVDLIPPVKPSGLTAFPKDKGVSLRWNPNNEPDLKGYNIYRSGEGEKSTKINKEIVKDNVYLDPEVETGEIYYYSVTAVDRALNESKRSEEVRVKR
jgi:fibronectin type 3 domain-containing protein